MITRTVQDNGIKSHNHDQQFQIGIVQVDAGSERRPMGEAVLRSFNDGLQKLGLRLVRRKKRASL